MRSSLFGFAVIAAIAVPVMAAAKDGGVRQLFDGKDTHGWVFIGRQPDQQGFAVDDGILHTTQGKGILWYTPEKFGNATIHVVYKMSNGKGNSGVFIRIPEAPRTGSDAINKGIEVQIDNRDNDWHSTGVLYSMTKAMARPYKPAGEWNTLDITLDGLRTIVKVNGTLVTDYDGKSPVPPKEKSYEPDRGPRPEFGYIALQNHDDEAIISFKEISVHSLNK
jgi:hypothetical protein